MSDVLSPAEQARAARWAADWLADAGFDVSETARDAMSSLSFHADKLDPPETVESLRAERDEALANARTWEDLADGWRDRAIELRGDVREANETIARLRATHTEAEAAWGRCLKPKFPRSWVGAACLEPEGVTQVRDCQDRLWLRDDGVWTRAGGFHSWWRLIEGYGPLTEVLS